MGATYTRQSTYTDGDIIQESDTNDEFDQLLAAFAASTGHSHDGTTGEGGPVTKLLGTGITIGDGTSGTDITVTFDGESNDGVLKWMEDEDYFEFSDDILVASTEKIQFRDTAIYINSSTDGQLDLVADTEIQIAATTVDINGNVDISGTLTVGSAGISEAELEILDGATVTTDELNLIDGGTARGTTAVASGDGILINDAGTMRMTNVDTVSTYFSSHSVGGSNIVTTGALNSGSITSGFGTIDTGSSTITTTGLISGGSLDIDNVLINGTTIGHTDDTDLITLADGVVTVAGEISVTTLDIGGTNVSSTAAELNILDGKAFLDEDNLASDSATGIASQQSIKAYVDAAGVTIADSTANTNFPVVFHNESNGLLDDTGALRYNPSTGTLLAPNLVVSGTTTTVNTVTMEAENAVVFEGATADAYETTLSIVDPTADHTQYLINQGGYIPVLAAATTTQISSTPAELNILDGATVVVGEINALDLGSTAVGTAIASKAVILDSNKDYTGLRNFTLSGELDAATGDFSGDVDVDGTLEADAITINGTAIGSIYGVVAGSSSIVTTGALNSGSITSGFGTIDIGSSAFTTTGTVNFGSLADGSITVTAFVDEDDMSTDSATLVPTQQSVKAYVDSSVASAATKGFAIAAAIVFG